MLAVTEAEGEGLAFSDIGKEAEEGCKDIHCILTWTVTCCSFKGLLPDASLVCLLGLAAALWDL